jgi:hypothetical protein
MMPPAQMPVNTVRFLREIRSTASRASSTAPTYLSNPQPACRASGLRHDMTKTCCPDPTRCSTRLRPGARSIA